MYLLNKKNAFTIKKILQLKENTLQLYLQLHL